MRFRRTAVLGLIVTVPLLIVCGLLWPRGQGAPTGVRAVELALLILFLASGALLVLPRALAEAKALPGPAIVGGPLVAGRLVLRDVRSGDAAALVATIDVEVVRANGWADEHRSDWEIVFHFPEVARENGAVAVCLADGPIIGVAIVQSAAGGGEVGSEGATVDLWLAPSHRREGYGTEIVAALADHLHARGATPVRVGTSVQNPAVRRVMAKLGALEVERVPLQLPDGSTIDAIWYEVPARST